MYAVIYVSGVFQPKQITEIKTCAIVNLMRGRGKFNVYEEIISLQFTVHDTSHYICKQCLRKLQIRTNHRELDEELFQSCSSKAYKAGLSIKKKAVHDLNAQESVSPEQRILLEESSDYYSNVRGSIHSSTLVKNRH